MKQEAVSINMQRIHNEQTRLQPGYVLTYSSETGFQTGSERLNKRLNRWWELFDKLARIPYESGKGDEKGLREMLSFVQGFYHQEHFLKAGVTYQEIAGAAVINLPGEGELASEEPVFISGHLDTVSPATHVEPYIDEEIVVRSKGEQILGADNLAAVAMEMAITEELILFHEPYLPTEIVFTPDEESDGLAIEEVPVGRAKRGLILDCADEPGVVILGSYGYNRFDAEISGLTDENALAFVGRLANRMGYHTVGRRGQGQPQFALPEGMDFTIDSISVGKNASRNTVPEDGEITGILSYTNANEAIRAIETLQQIHTSLVPIDGSASIVSSETNMLRFRLAFHGQAGHPKRDEGVTTVMPDVANAAEMLLRRRFPEDTIQTERDVRLTLAKIQSTQQENGMQLRLVGEARYQREEEANNVLEDLRSLVVSCGGTLEFARENRAYQLTQDTPVVRRLINILQQNNIPIRIVEASRGISDANNGNREGRSIVVTSEGTRNSHSSDESYPVMHGISSGNIVYDWLTTP